ncbi:hypothetical protein M1N08_00640 [Dehalococcoidia bacterium]|nr:hypothetical protein [Dehalococcoidia bacterium]
MLSGRTGFEVSSEEKLDLLLRCGVSPQKIISSNPLKSLLFYRQLMPLDEVLRL